MSISPVSRIALLVACFIGLLTWTAWSPDKHGDSAASRLDADPDMLAFHKMMGSDSLPVASLNIFFGSGVCVGCHGNDPLGFASVDEDGDDVNVVDAWRSSMMANSARDPFWKAKVAHEVHENPGHQTDIEDLCTKCHAPAGNYAAKFTGTDHYSMADLESDELGQDGVNCSVCHQQVAEGLGLSFSGELSFDTAYNIYGPYGSIFEPPMATLVGLTPTFGSHINDSELCAGCHTLITNTVDLAGNYTGGTFVEQATYHEWENSRYAAENITCQNCHLPWIPDAVVISSNYSFLLPRTPFGLHDMVGANTFMLELMKANREELGIPATDTHFDSTLAKTFRMLERTLDLDLEFIGYGSDTASFELKLSNKAGHKFPSGYPARRAHVEFTLLGEFGDTLWASGILDDLYALPSTGLDFQPHHQIIRNEEEVQVYEQIVGDVNGDPTTVLERGAEALKDNRLPPEGFSTGHLVYDTTQIIGNALADADFNYEAGSEGSGSDRLQYKVALGGYRGPVTVRSRVLYQSVPPSWTRDIFAISLPIIDSFKEMYWEQMPAPVVVADTSLELTIISTSLASLVPQIELYPNPAPEGLVQLRSNLAVERVKVLDLQGRLYDSSWNGELPGQIQLPEQSGMYLIQIKLEDGRELVRQAIR